MKKFYMRPDFLVIVLWILLCIPTVLFFQVRFMISTILFFVVPSTYLFLRKPKSPKRLGATLFIGTIASFSLDFLAEFNGAWTWAPEGQLIFHWKIMDYVTPDVMIWFIFWIVITIVTYEHFFERDKSDRISPRFKWGLLVTTCLTLLMIVLYYVYPTLLHFHYAYLVIGFMFGGPALLFICIKKPHTIPKFLKASIFLIFVFLAFEITALHLDQWRFPGEYIGLVPMFGVAVPFEELFWWIIMSTVISLTYYELLVDDGE